LFNINVQLTENNNKLILWFFNIETANMKQVFLRFFLFFDIGNNKLYSNQKLKKKNYIESYFFLHLKPSSSIGSGDLPLSINFQ
jgi:hypothetical protein